MLLSSTTSPTPACTSLTPLVSLLSQLYSAHGADVQLGLTPDAFITLGLLNPNLVTLRLDLCGRITDDAISAWSTSLRSLKRLELYGPFLVRVDAWKAFFAASPQLEGFLITQSPRFDLGCMQALAAHCPRVHELRLKEVGKLADAFVDVIAQMSPPAGWTLLDLADPAASLSEGALIRLLGAVAPTVRTLDLSGHVDLSDAVLAEGLAPHARQITHLRLANAPGLSDAGVGALFAGWANAPLWEADFARNAELAGGALDALLAHSSASLRALSLNGWRAVPTESLARIGETCARLERIDLSWCREADDFVVKNILDGCPACKDVKVWACNRLTAACPRKRGVNITGVELNAAS
jgi:DNA repair protein RAD7